MMSWRHESPKRQLCALLTLCRLYVSSSQQDKQAGVWTCSTFFIPIFAMAPMLGVCCCKQFSYKRFQQVVRLRRTLLIVSQTRHGAHLEDARHLQWALVVYGERVNLAIVSALHLVLRTSFLDGDILFHLLPTNGLILSHFG